jgi:hypothetical protein
MAVTSFVLPVLIGDGAIRALGTVWLTASRRQRVRRPHFMRRPESTPRGESLRRADLGEDLHDSRTFVAETKLTGRPHTAETRDETGASEEADRWGPSVKEKFPKYLHKYIFGLYTLPATGRPPWSSRRPFVSTLPVCRASVTVGLPSPRQPLSAPSFPAPASSYPALALFSQILVLLLPALA